MVEVVELVSADTNEEKLPQSQSNKKQCKKEYNDDGGISRLPDEILVRIVSLLRLKDATSTSILSRRWRDVWTYTTDLNFFYNRNFKWDRKNRTSRFMEWVNSVIQQHQGDIERFRVSLNTHQSDQSFSSCIENWITFAMEKRVRVLNLDLCDFGHRFRMNKPGNCFGGVEIFGSKNYAGFKSLKVLRLGVNVGGEVVEYLLSKCMVLQELRVCCSSRLINLRVAGPSLALKHLIIKNCVQIKTIEICDAQNLVYFDYCHRCARKDDNLRLLIRNVPKLDRVHISSGSMDYARVLLSCRLSQPKSLLLSFCGKTYEENGVYPMLKNIRWLILMLESHDKFNLLRLFPFMNAFPYMKRLRLRFLDLEDEELDVELVKPTNCPHRHLKQVSIFGYLGRTCDDEVVIYLIENALSLKRIFLHTRGIEKARSHAMEHLKVKIPSTIEFVCV